MSAHLTSLQDDSILDAQQQMTDDIAALFAVMLKKPHSLLVMVFDSIAGVIQAADAFCLYGDAPSFNVITELVFGVTNVRKSVKRTDSPVVCLHLVW